MSKSYFPSIALTSGQIKLITELVNQELPQAKVYLFGSRASGKAKKFSDVDLAIDNIKPINSAQLLKLQEQIAQKLPYLIDMIDLHTISKEFYEVVIKSGKLL